MKAIQQQRISRAKYYISLLSNISLTKINTKVQRKIRYN